MEGFLLSNRKLVPNLLLVTLSHRPVMWLRRSMLGHKAERWVSAPDVQVTCKPWHAGPFTTSMDSSVLMCKRQRRDTNHRKQKGGCQGLGRAVGSYCSRGIAFPLYRMKDFWRRMAAMVARPCERTSCHWTAHWTRGEDGKVYVRCILSQGRRNWEQETKQNKKSIRSDKKPEEGRQYPFCLTRELWGNAVHCVKPLFKLKNHINVVLMLVTELSDLSD